MDDLGIVAKLSGGRLLEKLCAAMADVATEVQASGKKGSVTLTLDFSVTTQGDDMVVIADKLTLKHPPKEGRPAFLFAVNGSLFTFDPRQPQLPEFRTVDRGTGEIRETGDVAPQVREV